jgi:hypothetical protein
MSNNLTDPKANEVELLSVFAENKPGILAKATQALADAQVNILWFKIIDGAGDKYGIIRFLVDRTQEGMAALKNSGFAIATSPILAVVADDNPGSLSKLTAALYEGKVDICNGSGYYLNQRVVLIIETQQQEAARAILTRQGYKILTRAEVEAFNIKKCG